MSKPVQHLLEFIAGVGGLILVIVFLWGVAQVVQQRSANQVDKGLTVVSEIENEEFERYQDASISGSEVLNLIKRYDGGNIGIIVTITTGATSTNTCYCKGLTVTSGVASYSDGVTLGPISEAKDVTKTNKYINPTKKFNGEVLKDSAGNIIGLHFTLI